MNMINTFEILENNIVYIVEEWQNGMVTKHIKPNDSPISESEANQSPPQPTTTQEVADSILSIVSDEYTNKVIDDYTLQLMEEGVL